MPRYSYDFMKAFAFSLLLTLIITLAFTACSPAPSTESRASIDATDTMPTRKQNVVGAKRTPAHYGDYVGDEIWRVYKVTSDSVKLSSDLGNNATVALASMPRIRKTELSSAHFWHCNFVTPDGRRYTFCRLRQR